MALQQSPVLPTEAQNSLVKLITGADHLHGGEVTIAADVGRRLRQEGAASKTGDQDADWISVL